MKLLLPVVREIGLRCRFLYRLKLRLIALDGDIGQRTQMNA